MADKKELDKRGIKMSFYEPAEDSYFLTEVVKSHLAELNKKEISLIKALDVGTGSGIQSKALINLGIKKQNILAVDINLEAIKQTKKLGIKTIKSDLFKKIKKTPHYDLVIFNPPYLPEDKYDKQIDTTGGKKGDEIIVRFIKQLKPHLTKNGFCFLLTSSFTPEKAWKDEAKKQNLKIKKIAEKKLFFEKLYVWKVRK